MTAYLIVRAKVDAAIKTPFDTWYQNEHLPEAFEAFKVISAKRGWSSVDPDIHVAFYEFSDLAAAEALIKSDVMKGFIAEFDRHWMGKVERTRELIAFSQTL